MGFRKGTGFTNLNKVMTANRGNKLGSAVAGGISTQNQGVNTGIQTAQQTFGQEAEKNRLDTDEAKNKRDQTIGRFNEANYKPDESKFQVSSGLQGQYNQQKQDLQGQQSAWKTDSDTQRGLIQSRLTADQDKLKGLTGPVYQNAGNSTSQSRIANTNAQNMIAKQQYDRQKKALGASTSSLQNLLNTFNTGAAGQAAEYGTQLSGLDTDFGTQSAAEKAQYMKDETGRLMAANAPGEQEIKDFTKYRTGTYGGPTELQDVGSLYGKAQQAEQAGELSRSAGGQQELLRRFVGGGKDYSQGERQLDTSLLGQDANAMRTAARATRGATNRVGEANQAASGLAKEYVGRAKIFGDETRGQLDAAGKPISANVDKDVLAAQNKEIGRAGALKSYQDILAGTDLKYANVDKTTRAGLALQDAMNSGYLSPQDAEKLAGQGGLMGRSEALGLDTNKLISERLSGTNAQNVNRAGVASDVDVARLNALGKLSGKTGTDLEFQDNRNRYQAGGIGLNTGSLQDYITRTENEKMPQGGGSGGQAVAGQSPLQKIIGGVASPAAGVGLLAGGLRTGALQTAAANNAARQGAMAAGETAGAEAAAASGLSPGVGYSAEYGATALPGAEAADLAIMQGMPGATGLEAGGAELAGAEAGLGGVGAGPVALAAMLGYDTLTGGDSTAKTAEGLTQLGSGVAGMGLQGKNSILKALMNNKIGNSAAGQQIQKLLGSEQELERKGLGELTKEGMNWSGGLRDLTQSGRLDQALSKLTGADAVKNLYTNAGNEVGKKLSTAFNGGKTGNWGTGEYNTTDATTGKKVKIGTYANRSSADIMKQLLSSGQLGRTGSMGKGGAEGAKASNLLQKYYADALKREGKKYSDENLKEHVDYTDKDVSSFLDRIKPASYDYKEEVKNSPLASKDRQLGVMAQDLEKSKLGKEAVSDTEQGKIVDYKDLQPKMLASLAALNQRLKKIEGKE